MISRRDLLQRTMALGAGALASQMPFLPAQAANAALRLYWWGSPDRSKRTLDVAKLFEQSHPGVQATGESVGGDYWTKLATMVVGRNLPDVVQFEPTTFPDYYRRGAMLDLDGYLGKGIKTDKFGPGTLGLTRIDGKVAGIALGVNSFAVIYDAEAFEKAGMKPPTGQTTWKEFADLSVELTKALGKDKVWASPNAARYNHLFDVWLHQRGKGLYTEAGQLGFTVDDAKEWYDYWDTLRKRGGCVAPDIQSLDQNMIDSNPLARGNSVMSFAYSNQLIGYQSVLKQKLGITTPPVTSTGGPSGLYYRPALIWCIGKTTKNPDEAAAFIDFFVNDQEAGKILGVERGVPVNLDVRETVKPTTDDVSRMTIDYVNAIGGRVGAYPPPAPKGATEFDQMVLRPIADQLSFGQLTVAEAAERLIAEGKRVLRV
ncbi:ABC transporter substrate-binding protein [Microvirga sp. 2MCAF38]|uniref:ABC transporter substrate-binding protein n=1 Tax=Microvirga sp. 2MCAF38 TaxID=3232989 RepID=UPI003F9A063B